VSLLFALNRSCLDRLPVSCVPEKVYGQTGDGDAKADEGALGIART
jgi:hypothetical protein